MTRLSLLSVGLLASLALTPGALAVCVGGSLLCTDAPYANAYEDSAGTVHVEARWVVSSSNPTIGNRVTEAHCSITDPTRSPTYITCTPVGGTNRIERRDYYYGTVVCVDLLNHLLFPCVVASALTGRCNVYVGEFVGPDPNSAPIFVCESYMRWGPGHDVCFNGGGTPWCVGFTPSTFCAFAGQWVGPNEAPEPYENTNGVSALCFGTYNVAAACNDGIDAVFPGRCAGLWATSGPCADGHYGSKYGYGAGGSRAELLCV